MSLADGHVAVAGISAGPGTTLASLLAAPGTASLPRSGAAPYTLLHGDAELEGVAFGASLTFSGERLERVSLVVGDPAIRGTSWESYDPAVVRAWHDAFLAERLGRGTPWNESAYPFGGVEYRMPWGTAGSYVHPQDHSAAIVLAYE